MDLSRILEKLDRLVEGRDYDGAKELLSYWIAEARQQHDERGELYLSNESMGVYRKTLDKEKAYANAANALRLVEKTGMEKTITAATTYINAATVYKAFGEANKSLPLFAKAKEIYEKELPEDDGRRGGLYNNYGLALLDEGQYDEAIASYNDALAVMDKVPHGNLEKAITYLNIADVYDRMRADEKTAESHTPEEWENIIGENVAKAEECLNDESLPHDGYYAFVAEKCAPGFDYYGHFMFKAILDERVEAFHRGAKT